MVAGEQKQDRGWVVVTSPVEEWGRWVGLRSGVGVKVKSKLRRISRGAGTHWSWEFPASSTSHCSELFCWCLSAGRGSCSPWALVREDALEELCVLSLQEDFNADFRPNPAQFRYLIIVCVVGFLAPQSFHSYFLPAAAGLFVKSHCAKLFKAGWCFLGSGSFKCGLRIPRKLLKK